ncbi:MAG: amidohydrolase family protein, partial [Candidatus Eisenbacteria bacterium]|nr:amidohydrolase family protein [Candidatus Eisenbacteria bacterium]
MCAPSYRCTTGSAWVASRPCRPASSADRALAVRCPPARTADGSSTGSDASALHEDDAHMTQNFTLRRVALQERDRREPLLCDLTFRQGRLSRLQPLPAGETPRLYATPGFWDAHIHLLHLGMGARRIDLSSTSSLEEALQALAERSRALSDDGVLWGVGWDESRWREGRPPVREEIDHWVAERPVVMRRVCGHLAILNSAALETARTRWPDIEPAGRLIEERSMALAQLWPESPEERVAALREVQHRALSMGITRVSEMGSSGATEAYVSLAEAGALRLAVDLFLPATAIERACELRDAGCFAGRKLRLGGIKLFTDGSVGARTAAFLEPYADRQESGTLLYADHALYEQLAACRERDLRVAVHAIGDAALGQLLRQLERLAAAGPLPPGWVSVEHAELPRPDMLDRAADLGVRFSMQPNFVARWGQPGGLYARALGGERWRRLNPFRAIWDGGFPFVFGSDGMPMDPVLGLQGAVQHPVTEQRLTPAEALTVYLGGRHAPRGYWDAHDWWRSGCAGAVLYREDPRELGTGGMEAAPIVGLLWEGEWVV